MPELVNPRIESYLRALYTDGDAVREEMEALATERKFPIVGPLVGRHLEVMARAIGARRVFELGSGYGYSALFFARAVGEQGEVHCTDSDEENVRLGHAFLGRAGLGARVTYHCEEATSALRRVGGIYDIVYNDIDKDGYPPVVELAHQHLRPGGLFISDNVLRRGLVLEGEDHGDPKTRGILEFTRLLFGHRGFLTCIDPTRDGVAVAVKL